MNKLNIILVVLVSLCGFIINCVLADDSDCRIFGAAPYKQDAGQNGFGSVSQVWETAKYQYTDFLSIEQQKNIITKADLNTAILNLKKYCCVNNLWWLSQNLKTCDDDKSFFNENALDSQYLFDHIFDVMMRRDALRIVQYRQSDSIGDTVSLGVATDPVIFIKLVTFCHFCQNLS